MPYVYDAEKDEATYFEEEPSFDASELIVADSKSEAPEPILTWPIATDDLV